MACGEKRQVSEAYWGSCEFHWNYPCGFEYCTYRFTYPCGITTCHTTVSYPCGVRWCRRWGVRYPCGVRYCRTTIPYPCPQYCTGSVSYPCGLEYCRGTGYRPCRRYHDVTKYCYDYSTARESCLVFVSTLTFCCNGEEYSADKACLGKFDAIHGGGTACYYERLTPSGPCTNASMPPGGPAGRVDPGSVAPHGSGLAAAESRVANAIRANLGRCPRCIGSAAVLTIGAWLATAVVPHDMRAIVAAIALLPSALFLAHIIAFVRNSRGCGCAEVPPSASASQTLPSTVS
jgi:hypothetical protein